MAFSFYAIFELKEFLRFAWVMAIARASDESLFLGLKTKKEAFIASFFVLINYNKVVII